MPHFVFTASAKKDIMRLSLDIRRRIGKKLQHLQGKSDTLAQLKKLTNHPSAEYRLRIGNYRILIDRTGDELLILSIRHRRESYR